MAKADRQPPPCMFTANIAFKETPSFKAPEDGPDISREHSLKGGVFIVMSIESDNNSSRSLASPHCPTSAGRWKSPSLTRRILKPFTNTASPGEAGNLGEITRGRGK